MMLMGAEILFYPTAIGTEPHDPELDTSRLWRRAMIGHAVSNVVPVVAANRIGTEGGQRFYGHSFICDERGDILAEFGAEETGVLVATLDLAAAKHRAAFGFFRDRRPGALWAAGGGRLMGATRQVSFTLKNEWSEDLSVSLSSWPEHYDLRKDETLRMSRARMSSKSWKWSLMQRD